jgi:hypothetical protein
MIDENDWGGGTCPAVRRLIESRALLLFFIIFVKNYKKGLAIFCVPIIMTGRVVLPSGCPAGIINPQSLAMGERNEKMKNYFCWHGNCRGGG